MGNELGKINTNSNDVEVSLQKKTLYENECKRIFFNLKRLNIDFKGKIGYKKNKSDELSPIILRGAGTIRHFSNTSYEVDVFSVEEKRILVKRILVPTKSVSLEVNKLVPEIDITYYLTGPMHGVYEVYTTDREGGILSLQTAINNSISLAKQEFETASSNLPNIKI